MSDVGLFPPGAILVLAALALSAAAGVVALICLLIALVRKGGPFVRRRAFGWAVGALGCAAACGLTVWSIDRPLPPTLGRWVDQESVFFIWMTLLILIGLLVGWRWNRAFRPIGDRPSSDESAHDPHRTSSIADRPPS